MVTRETLSEYVRRVLKEKGLSLVEVVHRAGGAISTSYISSITNGMVSNLTVEKLKALSRGLGVDEDEVFAVARGVCRDNGCGFEESQFAILYNKYQTLSSEEKNRVHMLLEILDHEISRGKTRSQTP